MATQAPGGSHAVLGKDLERQLSALLGRRFRTQIRKTGETPPRVSIIDVAVVITGLDANHVGQTLRRIKDRYPAVNSFWVDWKFPGPRQKNTPVTGVRGIVEVIMLLPGESATRVRRQAAELLCRWDGLNKGKAITQRAGLWIFAPRWLGGDLSLIDEVCRARGLQEALAVRAPEHPARVFGEAVEAGSSTDPAGACEQMVGRMLPSILEKLSETLTEKLTVHIDERLDERFAAFEKQQRHRAGPYALPDADPRPLSIAQFLKERTEPVPKNFAAAFGALVAVSGIQIEPHPCTRGCRRRRCRLSPRCSDRRRPSSRASAPRSAGATRSRIGRLWNTAGVIHRRIARASRAAPTALRAPARSRARAHWIS